MKASYCLLASTIVALAILMFGSVSADPTCALDCYKYTFFKDAGATANKYKSNKVVCIEKAVTDDDGVAACPEVDPDDTYVEPECGGAKQRTLWPLTDPTDCCTAGGVLDKIQVGNDGTLGTSDTRIMKWKCKDSRCPPPAPFGGGPIPTCLR